MTLSQGRVWWALLSELKPDHADLLSTDELNRAFSYRRHDDRRRSILGAALLRLLVADQTQCWPEAVVIDRSCRCGSPHGRPRLPGTGVNVSVSHSAELVVVAASEDCPVGVDVEEVQPGMAGRVPPLLLAPGESASTADEVVRLWTRKEAVVKATGDGLRTPLDQVVVAADGWLTKYPGRLPTARVVEIDLVPGFRGAVAMLTANPLELEVSDAGDVLRRHLPATVAGSVP